MEIAKYSLEGVNLKDIQNLLVGGFAFEDFYKFTSKSDQVFVIFSDKYSTATESDLMVSVIIEFLNEKQCRVEIVTGGGGYGASRDDFSSERISMMKVTTWLEQACEMNHWYLKRVDWLLAWNVYNW